MIRIDQAGVRYYQFKSLVRTGFFHGIYTRLGGVSPEPWQSLNIGGTVGDDSERVSENLIRMLSSASIQPEKLSQVRQIHSRKVVHMDQPRDALDEADGMISGEEGLFMLMRFADCVPIIIIDPVRRKTGIGHAGWKGTVKRVGGEVVRKMVEVFGSTPADLLAGIGPSVGPDHYPVGPEVVEKVKESFPEAWPKLIRAENGSVQLDLWLANQIALQDAGVKKIEIARICTACQPEEWFSHRGERGITGRFGALVGLPTKDHNGTA